MRHEHQRTFLWIITATLTLAIAAATPAVAQTTGSLLVGEMEDAEAELVTDLGPQAWSCRGQIVLRKTIGPLQKTTYTLRKLGLVGESVATSLGPTGPISMGLLREVALEVDDSTGIATGKAELALHYRLIDDVLGFEQVDDRGSNYISFTEVAGGLVKLRFRVQNTDAPQLFSGRAELQVTSPTLGVINTIFLAIVPFDIADVQLNTQQELCVQPVFVRDNENDPLPTGVTYATVRDRSEALWGECCIDLDFQQPEFVEDPDLKVIDSYAEQDTLRGMVDDADCVEVFFVESFNPACWGGAGVTYSSGTANAQIIVADNNLLTEPSCAACPTTLTAADCPACDPPPSDNNLAHELGHGMTLCHPGDGCSWPRADGTEDSMMEPSGFCLDNPNTQTEENCENVDNPLFRVARLLCGADLVAEAVEGFPPEEPLGYCRLTDPSGTEDLIVRVRNQGGNNTPATMTMVEFTIGQVTIEVSRPTFGLEPGEAIDLEPIPLPPNCYDPDCSFVIRVDAEDDVSETDEENNVREGACPG